MSSAYEGSVHMDLLFSRDMFLEPSRWSLDVLFRLITILQVVHLRRFLDMLPDEKTFVGFSHR